MQPAADRNRASRIRAKAREAGLAGEPYDDFWEVDYPGKGVEVCQAWAEAIWERHAAQQAHGQTPGRSRELLRVAVEDAKARRSSRRSESPE